LFTDSGALTGAIDYTGDTYNKVGELFEKQVRGVKKLYLYFSLYN